MLLIVPLRSCWLESLYRHIPAHLQLSDTAEDTLLSAYFGTATPHAVVAVTNRIFPAVVRLDVAQEIYAEGKRTLRRGIGSGVIVSPEGYVLTNNHVVDHMDDIEVMLTDGRHAKAKVIGTDPDTDLAVLKIDLERLPAITLGNSETLRVGDPVLPPLGIRQRGPAPSETRLLLIRHAESTANADGVAGGEGSDADIGSWGL